MSKAEVFCLKWKNHNTNLRTVLCNLLTDAEFCDITLAAEGQFIQAHKLVLIACSDYFKALLTPLRDGQHPLIILDGITFPELTSLLDYMYYGEVSISKSDLPSLIKCSKALKVKSLGEVSNQLESLDPKESSVGRDCVANSEAEDSNIVEVQDDAKTYYNDETTEKVQSSIVFEESMEEEMDEEEEILYLDQNNQIINRPDQLLDNQSVETVICIREAASQDTQEQEQNQICDAMIKAPYGHITKLGETIKEPTIKGVNERNKDTYKTDLKQDMKKIEVEMEFDDFQSQQPLSPSKIFSATGPQYRKKQSKVWTYFEKSSDGAHVICNSCGEVQRFMSNTTNMIRHIKKAHSTKEKCKYTEPIRRVKQLRRKVCQRSPVWNYFHKIAHLNKVQCKLCLENYSYSGNTTNLRFHMRTRHSDVYNKIDDEQARKDEMKVTKQDYENMEHSLRTETKKVNVEMVVDKASEAKAETISEEVCNLECGDLGGPVYVATAPASGYLL